MRQGRVYNNDILAGSIIETDEGKYIFRYDDNYFISRYPAISVTIPKTQQEYHSEILFPFFFNMLSEGTNRKLQSRIYKLDEADFFGLLLKTAANETIGAIRVEEIKQ